jgi:hypothetical protein
MSRRIRGLALSAVLCGAAQCAAAADALSSSYSEAAYLNSRVDDGATRDTPEGFRVGASIGLASFLNFMGGYDQRRSGGERLGFGSAGFAFHTRHPVYRFHLGATYERIVADAAEPEEGYGVEAGLAYALPNLELQAAYRHLDFGESATGADLGGSRYGASVALQLSNWWSLVAGYSVREHELGGPGATTTEFDEWTVGLRRHFVTATDRRARKGGVLSGGAE